MRAFAALLDRVQLSNSRNAKLRLVRDFLRDTPDPERGWALAVLTGDLRFDAAKPNLIRKLVEARMDPVLFAWSYEFVGDLADTVALVWPARRGAASTDSRMARLPGGEPAATSPGGARPGANREPDLTEVIEALRTSHRAATPALLEGWLDALDADGRWALLKVLTRALRVGLSARLAKQAAADLAPLYGSTVDVSEIEEVWHAVEAPYGELFAWLEGRGPRPDPDKPGRFRPVMLAHPVEEADLGRLDPKAFAAEWKWDGIRVQAVKEGATAALWSRSGDEISTAFPDLMAALDFEGVIDGELLVMRPDPAGVLRVAPFGDLQQRLNRKAVDAKTAARFPAAIRAYDLLAEAGEDLRALPFADRRRRLQAFVAAHGGPRLDLSPLVAFDTWEDLAETRANPPGGDPAAAEGLMLKRWDSLYESGRPKGPWWKWKRDPFTVDAVMMYAQRGHGRRSSFYSDYTFGVWKEGALTPVGKAYSGFTDEELKRLDKFVRDHTTDRFGPVRAVRADKAFGLVLEVAFEGLQRSTRHKSGVAMRFPRIARIRWDKPAAEADGIEALEALLARMEAGRGA